MQSNETVSAASEAIIFVDFDVSSAALDELHSQHQMSKYIPS